MNSKTYDLKYFSKGLEIFFRKRLKSGANIDILAPSVNQYHNDIANFCIQQISLFNSEFFLTWFDKTVNSYQGNRIPDEAYFIDQINDFLRELQNASEECFLIIPLQFSLLDKNIYLDNNCFILSSVNNGSNKFFLGTGRKSSRHICRWLSKRIGLDKTDHTITNYLIDFEKYYSKYILYHPLLVVCQRDIFENVKDYSVWLALYAQNCLKVILIAKNRNADMEHGVPVDYENMKHVFVYSKRAHISSIPVWRHQNYLPCDLQRIASMRKAFCELLELWNIDTELSHIFRKAIRFFCWDVERLSRPLEYESILIQMTFTGIETFLLSFSNRGEKKSKIATLMCRFYRGRSYTKKQIRDSVITLYQSRSDYIHSGKNSSHKYQPHLTDSLDFKPADESLIIVRRVFANILMDFPRRHEELLRKSSGLSEWATICSRESKRLRRSK